MGKDAAFRAIKQAILNPPDGKVAELHLQVLKYAEDLRDVSGKDFCASLEIEESYATEYAKMKKISARLRAAGLDPDRI